MGVNFPIFVDTGEVTGCPLADGSSRTTPIFPTTPGSLLREVHKAKDSLLGTGGSKGSLWKEASVCFSLSSDAQGQPRLPKGSCPSAHPLHKHLKGMLNIGAQVSEGAAFAQHKPGQLVRWGKSTESHGDLWS